MKPILFEIPKTGNSSIRVQLDEDLHFYDKLHFHPEFQITIIEKGEGIFFGGTGMIKFKPGSIFFIGNNTPHLFKSAKKYYTPDSPGVSALSLFFSQHYFGDAFFGLPEMSKLADFLISAGRVIHVERKYNEQLAQRILDMRDAKYENLIILLLQILQDLKEAEKEFLNPEVHEYELKEAGFAKLDKVLNFTFSNASENINIEKIAKKANLSRSQFSRYFKERTGKSYINFLNEVRVENACSKLMEESENIEQICYEVGFNNLSIFNRHFRKIKNMTPSEYRKRFIL